jgi:hypothetical protein
MSSLFIVQLEARKLFIIAILYKYVLVSLIEMAIGLVRILMENRLLMGKLKLIFIKGKLNFLGYFLIKSMVICIKKN